MVHFVFHLVPSAAPPCTEQPTLFLHPRGCGEARDARGAVVLAARVSRLLRMVDRRLTNFPPDRVLCFHGEAVEEVTSPLGSPAAPAGDSRAAAMAADAPSCLAAYCDRSTTSALGSGLHSIN